MIDDDLAAVVMHPGNAPIAGALRQIQYARSRRRQQARMAAPFGCAGIHPSIRGIPGRLSLVPIRSGIGHNEQSLIRSRRAASQICMRGYDAAVLPANADLHALSNHHSDAMHEMWHADEAGPHRAARTESGFADLPVRPVRLRREFLEADVARGGVVALSVSVIAFYGVWAHGHRAWMFGVKRSRFAVRKVSPAIRFAQPLPAVFGVKRGAVTAQ